MKVNVRDGLDLCIDKEDDPFSPCVISIYLEDTVNNRFQDLALIKKDEDNMSLSVWADCMDDDVTDCFAIKIRR